jgi:hypothetical protein
MPLNRKDWALLAIAAAEGQSLSPVQLQKSLFLLGREMAPQVGTDFDQFEPYNYGPFDVRVYQDAELLERVGLVAISQAPGVRYNEYRITTEGTTAARHVREQAPPKAADYLLRVVEWARGLSFSDLVRAIYARYPETRANSVFNG